MIRSDYSRVDQDYKRTFSSLKLQNGYFRAHSIYDQCQGGLESIVRGLLKDPLMKVDRWFSQDLTQHLFETTNELGVPFHFDLVSINIQRGREVGVPSYKAMRKLCNLPELSTWTALKTAIAPETVDLFKSLYK
jgi:peroxidase